MFKLDIKNFSGLKNIKVNLNDNKIDRDKDPAFYFEIGNKSFMYSFTLEKWVDVSDTIYLKSKEYFNTVSELESLNSKEYKELKKITKDIRNGDKITLITTIKQNIESLVYNHNIKI